MVRERILLTVGPTNGGIGTHVHLLARQLVERGHRVTVCGPALTRDAFQWDDTGAGYVVAPVAAGGAAAIVPARAAVRRLADEHDVVHAHGTRAAALVGSVRGGGPAVGTWHNAPVGSRAQRAAHAVTERVAARRCDVTIGASPDLAARARRAGGRDVRFVPVVAPPLPPPARDPAQVRAALGAGSRPIVLSVARLAPQKRLDLLVEATAGWADDPDGPLVLVAGGGPLGPDLEQQAARCRSPLRLLGHRTDVSDLLAAADAVVLTSDWEARPLVLQEALRAGRAAVATDVGGVGDLVGDAAVLVPAGDAGAVRRALERVLADPAERDRLASAARQRSAGWPTVAEMVDRIEVVYAEVRAAR